MTEILPVTEALKILGDETRVKILHLIHCRELAVGEITEALAMNQSAVSNQLSLLKKSGLVDIRREGTRMFYRLTENSGINQKLLDEVFSQSSDENLFDYEETAISQIMEVRRKSSLDFFETGSEADQPTKESPASLLTGVTRLISGQVLADLGCGSGELTYLLSEGGNQVTGIDNSPRRIEEARRKHPSPPGSEGTNLIFKVAEMDNTGLGPDSQDGVILSQSLHHAADPAKVLAECHRILKSSGRLVLIDLLSHNHEEYRQIRGDLWLGFDPDELKKLLKDNHLEPTGTDRLITEDRTDDPVTLIISARKE